jgi:hypothetical protein
VIVMGFMDAESREIQGEAMEEFAGGGAVIW